jgi:site-specific recombinase XerD
MQGTIPERRKTTAIAMITVDKYLDAANRENTRRSYASDIRHFEESWGGYLPATVDSVSRYLAAHAESLSLNTLKRRLAALSRWHQDQGFPDPTKTATVRQVLKGIRALHPEQEKRARPLELLVLQQVSEWLEDGIAVASERKDRGSALSHARNRAMLLLGFWRGFRSTSWSISGWKTSRSLQVKDWSAICLAAREIARCKAESTLARRFPGCVPSTR